MQAFHSIECFKELCKLRNQHGLYISYDSDRFGYGDIKLACPFVNIDDFIQDRNIFLFDTEQECRKHFDMIVGDDGPTKTNKYNGDVRVYALTCDNEGLLKTENT